MSSLFFAKMISARRNEPRKRSELFRVFESASFEDAIAVMGAAVAEIVRLDHDPRWENIWRSVSVWLTTWDIGHKPSVLDIELAAFLNEPRKNYAPPKTKRVGSCQRGRASVTKSTWQRSQWS